MASMSISVCKGGGSIGHNNREFKTKNIDSERTHLNVVYKQEPIKEAYQKLFGAEVERYNVGKRPCRQIHDYMEHVRTSKNGEKVFYETIVQIGNCETCATLSENGELAKQMLDEYMKDFQNRNPNLYVFNAVLHLDEATPHLHIDWIPVAREYKQGLQVRNSLNKALEQQGYDGKSTKWENSTQRWQEAEKKAVEQVMERYGWERSPEKGVKLPHLQIEVYKAQEQLKELQEELDIAGTVADNYLEMKLIYEQDAEKAVEEREKVRDEVFILRSEKTSLEGDIEVLRAEKESLEELTERKAEIETELPDLENRINEARSELEAVETAVKKKIGEGEALFGKSNLREQIAQAKKERDDKHRLNLYDMVMATFPSVADLVRQCIEQLERGKVRNKEKDRFE